MSLLHSRKTFQKILFPNFGLDGKKINEVLFCQSFLETHPMKCIQGRFFTVDGLVDDEESLRMEIYDRIKDYTCCGIAKKASQLLDALKLACYSPPLPVQLDRIHVANGTYYLDGRFTEEKEYCMNRLKDRAASLGAATYTTYAYDVKTYIFPYFQDHAISVVNVAPKDLEGFYQYELQDDDASAEELLQFHEAITACLNYAKELGWIKENPAEEVNPCSDQAPIRFDEFILEWLEIMKTKLGATTYASYVSNVNTCIVPYFKQKRYTLQDLERHPKYIQEFYKHLMDSGLSPSTVIRRHANIRKCLQYAFQIGLIKSNPADRVEKPGKQNMIPPSITRRS